MSRCGATRGYLPPKKAEKLGDEGWVQTLSEMPGFVAHYLVDAGDGVMVKSAS